MKGWGRLALTALLCLALAACGGGERAPFDPEATARALVVEPGVFSEELERLDTVIAVRQYGLERYLTEEQAADPPAEPTGQYGGGAPTVAAYRSTGATAEEVAVIAFAGEDQAKEYEAWAPTYLDEQREANVDYRPQEMPKLDGALVRRQGSSVLLLVAADYQAAERVLER